MQTLEEKRLYRRSWYRRNLEWVREREKLRQRRHRAKDPEKSRAYIRKCWRSHKVRNRRFVNAYKFAVGCCDCSERDPIVLDFDHVRGAKRHRVSTMVALGWSLLTIVREIEKCEARCANCHRRRHAH